MAKKPKDTRIETITHDGQTRTNIPTAELENLVRDEEVKPQKVEYPRKNNPDEAPELYARNWDLDPQLVWKGKDEEDKEPLIVDAVPIYVQEQIQPKAIIEEIKRQSKKAKIDDGEETPDLFADWAQELDPEDKLEFYQHAQKWTNRMILGDSLQVMTSLSEKEGLKGQVQCIYFDPPYGINFGSNWQPSSKNTIVKSDDITRQPEMIKAFRDTWVSGINSYLSYVRDRLTAARELLTESGSFFLQIGDENVHLVRNVLEEVFGRENFITQIAVKKTAGLGKGQMPEVLDYVIWFAKNKEALKKRTLFQNKETEDDQAYVFERDKIGNLNRPPKGRNINLEQVARKQIMLAAGRTESCIYPINYDGQEYLPTANRSWSTNQKGMERLLRAKRVTKSGNTLNYIRMLKDNPVNPVSNLWSDTVSGSSMDKIYVVQTSTKIVERCVLMTTDPGDLVIDPTCGSGTAAYVCEKWGRRWITIDTSRVSISLARSRILGSKFDFYKLNGHPNSKNVIDFHFQSAPRVTLSSIANNAEIDVIWNKYQEEIQELFLKLNVTSGAQFNEYNLPSTPKEDWSNETKSLFNQLVNKCAERLQAIDNSIDLNSEKQILVDKPEIVSNVVRVAGPFTVESLSPHRIVPTDTEDEALLEQLAGEATEAGQELAQYKSKRLRPKSVEEGETRFLDIVQENLAKAGVQNTKRGERLEFLALDPWPNGRHIQFEGRYTENGREKKAAICVGPEYGTVTRSLMVQAAREAADYFDILVVLGFAFEAHADEDLLNIGRLTVLRARMNNDLHMADRLKSGKSGNLFVVFGEPDIELRKSENDKLEVEIKGVDIFDPTTGDVKASSPDDIACWFIDTDYNDEAFFVRHAYFSGGGPDPFKRLKTTLKADINEDAWASLYSTVSRPFEKPSTGRIAVKAINHYGDEVLKVFDV